VSIINVFYKLHMLIYSGRIETIVIQFLQAVVSRLLRSVTPGRPKCVEGRVEEMMEVQGRQDLCPEKPIASSIEIYRRRMHDQ
jgi:hypothetical protein